MGDLPEQGPLDRGIALYHDGGAPSVREYLSLDKADFDRIDALARSLGYKEGAAQFIQEAIKEKLIAEGAEGVDAVSTSQRRLFKTFVTVGSKILTSFLRWLWSKAQPLLPG